MDPITILRVALTKGLVDVGRRVIEIGTALAMDVAADQIKKWLENRFQKEAFTTEDKLLRDAILTALEQSGAPTTDEEKFKSWFEHTGLERLKDESASALRQQLARALIGFTDQNQEIPEDLLIALDWPKNQYEELSELLINLRGSLAKIEGWKDLLAYADAAAERNLLNEILDQLSDIDNSFIHTSAGRALRVAVVQLGLSPKEAAEIEKVYREGLINEYHYHTITGLAQLSRLVRLPLQDIYLELDLLELGSEPEKQIYLNDEVVIPNSREITTNFGNPQSRVSNFLSKAQQLVIVGKPGSGKTITLKFFTLMLALGRAGAIRLELEDPYIPLMVRLADYARALQKKPNLALESFLMEYIGEYYPGANRQGEFLQLALQKGACMILLDGLDEVGDIGDSLLQGQTLRSQVLKQVRRFAARRCANANSNRLIVTSRLEGYRPGDLPGFLEMELSPLRTIQEIETFLQRWFTALEQEMDPKISYELAFRRAERDRVNRLIPVISNWNSIKRLAMNPLLLTILAIIHETGKRLPHRRVELYEIVTKTMIENWRQAQTDHVSSLYDTLHTTDVYYIMSSLAYWIHENQPGGTMPESKWQQKIEELLAKEGYKDETADLVARFLHHARQETGLLTERSPNQIGFFHLTLEEYLAAVEIARKENKERSKMLEYHWPNPRWQEAILLAAGVLDMRGNFTAYTNFITSLLEMDIPTQSLAGRPAVLAGLAISDLQPQKQTMSTFRKVIQALTQTMQDLDKETMLPTTNGLIPNPIRADAADVLDGLGWKPKKLHDFVIISLNGVKTSSNVEDKIPSSNFIFAIAKFPVTNVQYQRFLEADDFDDPDLWSHFPKFDEFSQPMGRDWGDAGWEWLQRQFEYQSKEPTEKIYPTFWNDPRFGISRKCVPVVGVSWFEANAYCRWLHRHWDNIEEGKANPGLQPIQIRLPTEFEWVYAAGNGEKTERFPWDTNSSTSKEINDITRRANVRESGLRRTTPVALYPLGKSYPYGLWDLAGNVWEWMANYYSSAHLYLALRSGSWLNTTEFARLTGRLYNFGPSNRMNNRGFRVVATLSRV